MTLLGYYEEAILKGDIVDDALQRDMLAHFQRLEDELCAPYRKTWLPWQTKQVIKGIYIYGPVGAGKTYLVDLFFHATKEKKKRRFHFHHFMQQIDSQLRQQQGKKNPVTLIAQKIAQTTRVLCFDEFLVNDVAYAMILAELLQALHKAGVILVISSNTKPDELYLNGVHRVRFLPAIASIKQHCDILFLNEKRDYRVGREPLLETYLYPLNEKTTAIMQAQFDGLESNIDSAGTVSIQNRDIPYLKRGDKSIWFDFAVLCHFPRSQLDYLEIADKFDTVFISGLPRLTAHHTAQTIMFIHCIDVMYDKGINLVLAAEVPLAELYVSGEMQDSFKRTYSRLVEMQSVDYLSRHPRRAIQALDTQ